MYNTAETYLTLRRVFVILHMNAHMSLPQIWPQFIKTGIILSLKEASSVPQNKTQKM